MAPTLETITGDRKINKQQAIVSNLDDEQKVKIRTNTPFQNMLDQIQAVFDRPDKSVDVDEIWDILKNYKSNPSDWSKFAYYEHGNYKRNLVAEHQKYNVMILTWAPGTRSCIHDHSGSHCFMKVSCLDDDEVVPPPAVLQDFLLFLLILLLIYSHCYHRDLSLTDT